MTNSEAFELVIKAALSHAFSLKSQGLTWRAEKIFEAVAKLEEEYEQV